MKTVLSSLHQVGPLIIWFYKVFIWYLHRNSSKKKIPRFNKSFKNFIILLNIFMTYIEIWKNLYLYINIPRLYVYLFESMCVLLYIYNVYFLILRWKMAGWGLRQKNALRLHGKINIQNVFDNCFRKYQ